MQVEDGDLCNSYPPLHAGGCQCLGAKDGQRSVQEDSQRRRTMSTPVTPVTKGWSSGTDLSYARKDTMILDKLPSQDSTTEENVRIQGAELEDRTRPSHKEEEAS